MKIKQLSFLFALIFSSSIHAKKIEGYIIDNNGLRSEVVFKINTFSYLGEPDYPKMQESIEYYINDKLVTLYPDNCKKFGFVFFDDSVEFVSVPNKYQEETNIYSSKIFLRWKIRGSVILYYFYYGQLTAGGFSNGVSVMSNSLLNGWILQNELGPYIFIKHGKGEKEDYIKLFYDWPEMVSGIESGKLDGRDMEIMVKVYNKWKILHREKIEINDSININKTLYNK